MATSTSIPAALPRIEAAISNGILKGGSWGDGNSAVCMMSAAVPGAKSTADCVTSGWPEWLAELNVYLFDATVGAADEDAARAHYALDIARAVLVEVDMDRACDLFLIRRLDTGDYSALKTLRSLAGDFSEQISAVEGVVRLLRRRVAGENVDSDLAAAAADAADARAAAYAAADAADARAAYAACAAAAHAVDADARAAAYAAALARAAYAADADRAAIAAARADIIHALRCAAV